MPILGKAVPFWKLKKQGKGMVALEKETVACAYKPQTHNATS